MMEEETAILSVILTFLCGLLIIVFNKKKTLSGFLLAAILLIFSSYSFISLAVINSWVVYVPYLFCLAKPLYLALPPFCYLYFKYAIFNKSIISKADVLHFIPSFIVFADLAYYYISDYELISSNIDLVINNVDERYKIGYGLIPGSVYLAIKAGQAVCYLVLIWLLFYFPPGNLAFKSLNSAKRSWLIIFGISISLLFVLITYNTSHPIFNFLHFEHLKKIDPVKVSHILPLGMVLLLFFYPSVIYRSVSLEQKNSAIKNDAEEELEAGNQAQAISAEKLDAFIERIENLNNDFRFFKSIATIADLADYLKIPPRHLTYILNHHYEMRFTDFINGHRVRYIIRQFGTGFLKELTMEAIAFEAGFSSRSTFFTAFKKYTGKNPSQFLKAQLLQRNN